MRHSIITISMAVAASAATAFSAFGEGAPYRVLTAKGAVEIDPVSNGVFRITTLPTRDAATPAPTQAAAGHGSPAGITAWSSPGKFTVASPSTIVEVDKTTGKVSFLNHEKAVLLQEAESARKDGDGQSVVFLTPKGERFYGAGERGHSLTLNGSELPMWNRANYGYGEGDSRISQANICMPYIVSDRGNGILIDDYAKANLKIGADTILYSTIAGKPLSYYFINGDGSLAGATENFTGLTGRQPLPPFWTLGYITSKYGYHNQKEAYGAIDSLKQRDYPVDGMVLDLYWYGVETDMGRLAWDSKQWPDHRKMLADLNAQGIHVVPIHQPYINKIGALDNYNLLD
ncbi:MAG: hypothetical protein K2K93_11345, partial [Muribaculaceae bacterium]|nr:hypothetical protein [Muribaculaceae bacterium]